MNSVEFSVIIPVFKSVDTLQPLFEGIKAIMSEMKKTYEVIFVEDFGSKESWQELLRLKKIYPEDIIIIRLSRNFGQNGATVCGIDQSRGKKVITIDDDLQIHPKEIRKLIDVHLATDADVVYGNYKASDSFIRKVGSKIIKWIFNKSNGGNSIGSSFRLIDEHIVERIKFHSQDHLFINQVINWYTIDFQIIEVEVKTREEGSSGYSLLNLAVLSFKLIFHYTNLPLKITIYSCLLSVIACLSIIIYHIYKHAELDILWVVLLMGLALILGGMSVLGVFINRIYTSRVKRPNYAIKFRL
jgi:glycosyltransferase involved in cell wall biosynthesis